jgi:hypothetical protein
MARGSYQCDSLQNNSNWENCIANTEPNRDRDAVPVNEPVTRCAFDFDWDRIVGLHSTLLFERVGTTALSVQPFGALLFAGLRLALTPALSAPATPCRLPRKPRRSALPSSGNLAVRS